MKSKWMVLGLLLLAGCNAGSPTGVIEGSVVPSEALPTVLVLSDGDVVAETRPNRMTGEFRVEVSPGRYDLVATADGYVPDDSITGTEVAAGQTASVEQIVLFRAGTGSISGHVDPRDAEATVSALQFGAVIASVSADADGEFLLTDLPVGTYEVTVTAPGYQRYEAAAGVQVTEGATAMLDPITLSPSTTPTGSVVGVVAPAESGATVTVLLEGVPSGSTSASTDDGSFRIDGLEPGSYQLDVEASGYGTFQVSDVVVEGDGVTDVGTVTLVEPTRVVAGEVLDLDTRAPVPGVVVTIAGVSDQTGPDGRFQIADPPAGTATLHMERPFYVPGSQIVEVPAEGTVDLSLDLAPSGRVEGVVQTSGGAGIGSAVVEGGGASASTNGSGAYLLVHVRPGRYEVRARATGYAQASQVVDVESGMTTTADFLLTESGAVMGQITDSSTGSGISGATITIAGKTIATGSDGNYELPGVPEGTHTASISATHYEPSSQSVTVPAGGTASLDAALTPVPRVTVTGRVTARDGSPVEDAYVRLGGSYSHSTYTDVDGYYTIPDYSGDPLVPVDVDEISVRADEYPTAERTIDLTSGASTVTVDVVLDEYATVFGRVVDSSTGEGVEDVRVYCGGTANTGPDGGFAIADVPPGDVTCSVSSTCVAYEPQYLTLSSGEVREVTLLATYRADVEVQVRNEADGTPVPNAEVWSDRQETVADESGIAILECLYQGTTTIYAWKPGYSSGATRVLVPETGTVQAWIDLEPAQ